MNRHVHIDIDVKIDEKRLLDFARGLQSLTEAISAGGWCSVRTDVPTRALREEFAADDWEIRL